MKLNAKKTKIMFVGKGQYKDIEIDGQILERVYDFIFWALPNPLTVTAKLTLPGVLLWLRVRWLILRIYGEIETYHLN